MIDFIFHGHFYQPPRENPWTDELPLEPSAAPFHDWNQRITAECYRANAFARVLDDQGRIEDIVNNYERISFNFGPTLLRWLERHDRQTVQRIVAADAESVRLRGGHGNAIAQAYNHVILPLANARDRRTQIEWGLAEFRHRFARDAEAMWLPETAANHDVLEDLIAAGLRYVVLAPQQAARVRDPAAERSPESKPWEDVRGGKVDARRPYRYLHRDGSGRELAVFFYAGSLAHQVSFGDALRSSDRFVEHVRSVEAEAGMLVHLAVDGETAGHHMTWGDRVLAHVLLRRLEREGYRPTNYGEFLDRHPATAEVELDLGPKGEGTSWSCAHGVGRWVRDCGCRMRHDRDWNQAWRTPLRQALDLLRDAAAPFFEERGGALLRDPWAARDAAVELVLRPDPAARQAFLDRYAKAEATRDERAQVSALRLLEMQHQLLLMYTSCGWFFDDVAGIETIQVLRHAARAMDLWEELDGGPPRASFLEALAEAASNEPTRGHGADVFRRHVDTARTAPAQVAVHLVREELTSLDAHAPAGNVGKRSLYRFERPRVELERRGDARWVLARVCLEHERTLETSDQVVVIVQLGDTARVGVTEVAGEERFDAWAGELRALVADVPAHCRVEQLDRLFHTWGLSVAAGDEHREAKRDGEPGSPAKTEPSTAGAGSGLDAELPFVRPAEGTSSPSDSALQSLQSWLWAHDAIQKRLVRGVEQLPVDGSAAERRLPELLQRLEHVRRIHGELDLRRVQEAFHRRFLLEPTDDALARWPDGLRELGHRLGFVLPDER